MPLATQAAYEADFYTWTQEQAQLLRTGRLDEVDVANIVEEIETLGRNEFSKLVGYYEAILVHMLRWEHQPNFRSRAWACKIAIQRLHLGYLLEDSPGLSSRKQDALKRAYSTARLQAIVGTGFAESTFPETCPYTLANVLTRPYDLD
jgi:Domain of unknown function DUF29